MLCTPRAVNPQDFHSGWRGQARFPSPGQDTNASSPLGWPLPGPLLITHAACWSALSEDSGDPLQISTVGPLSAVLSDTLSWELLPPCIPRLPALSPAPPAFPVCSCSPEPLSSGSGGQAGVLVGLTSLVSMSFRDHSPLLPDILSL